MSGRILITGATGNVGAPIVRCLMSAGADVRACASGPESALRLPEGAPWVRFDFTDESTFAAALEGVSSVFLVRPPHMSKAEAFRPFVKAMVAAGVSHVVFLSLMGVERNPIVPHHGIERLLRRSGIPWTFLRPSFYMQNLSTTHLADIRQHSEVCVPAGRGRTSFIDVADIAECAAEVLTRDGHIGRAYTLTGPSAPTYAEVASALSAVTGREIRYTNPSGSAFAARMREQGLDAAMITVMRGIYLVAKLGMAGGVTSDVEDLLGRPARSLREFAEQNAAVFGLL